MAELKILTGDQIKTIECPAGALLSDVLRMHQAGTPMPCGGKGTCGKCRVQATGALSELSAQEAAFLSEQEQRQGVRLACMTRIEGNAAVQTSGLEALQNTVIQMEGGELTVQASPLSHGLGAAVDLGTTTVAAYLYRLSDGCRLQAAGSANPQAAWGADVITRIGRALEGEGAALAQSIQSCVDELLVQMCQHAGVLTEEITQVVITANTAMLYLLTGSSPAELSHAPFLADRLFGERYTGEQLGLTCALRAQVSLPRCISAFVGADITTAILASGMKKSMHPVLLLDIGTNGEMALWKDGRLSCCSTAAGPALEGGNIYMGMPALPGAINTVRRCGDRISYTTIGQEPARGLCGSGLIDAIAVLCDAGVIEDTGAIAEEGHAFLPCLCEVDGCPAFRFEGCDVILTQQDIRNVQLAKGAICAGLLTLLEQEQLTPEQVDTLYLAGGFGSFLSLQSAARIGLIPPLLKEKTRVIGNAAGAGACMLLQNAEYWQQVEETARQASTINLAQNPAFSRHYMDCMLFESIEE